jgi:DNA-binding GntR family transcriptional regulator
MTSPAGRTILEDWLLTELACAEQLTPRELAERLSLPRPLVIDALIGLAERGLLEDASADVDSAGLDEPDGPRRNRQ